MLLSLHLATQVDRGQYLDFDSHAGVLSSGCYVVRKKGLQNFSWFHGVCQILRTQVQERLDMLKIEKVDLPVRYHRARVEAGFDPETYSWQELLSHCTLWSSDLALAYRCIALNTAVHAWLW